MQKHVAYDTRFFNRQMSESERSAAIVVPLILDLFPDTASVIDVGCGAGTWLMHFRNAGIARIKGLDGGTPDAAQMRIDSGEFQHVDLLEPPPVTERYDIAVSLEVAEHLPPESGPDFVRYLTQLSNRVVFSAAVPGQGGDYHTNERLLSYWRDRFADLDFDMFDVLRPRLWTDQRIAFWYRQNIAAFVKSGTAHGLGAAPRGGELVDIIHPELLHIARSKEAALRAKVQNRPSKRFRRWLWELSG